MEKVRESGVGVADAAAGALLRPPAARHADAFSAIARRLDSLKLKLFLAIAGANAVLALAAWLVFSWSFDRGVVESLQRRDMARLDAFVATLAEEYGTRRSWDPIAADAERWQERSRVALGLSPVPRRSADGGRLPPPTEVPRDPPPTVDFRLLLLDAEKRLVAGRPEMVSRARYKPIVWQERTVGYLGYVPRTGLAEAFERVHSARQRWQFGAIAVGMLAAALALGAGLAHWLTRRVRTLARGTAMLIRGEYDARIPASGSDELAQLAHDFNELARTLEAARQARRQWVADLAHELRTPLSILRGEIEALQDGVRDHGPETLASLAHEVNRISRLVEDLHALSQSDLGSLTYYMERLDLTELVEEAVEAHRGALDDRRIALELDVKPGLHVTGDAARLAQVIANLMQNTTRYTDAPGRLQVRLHPEDGWAILDWSDSSPGVRDEDLPRLTDRLFRVDAARRRPEGAAGGAGLGLAIARAIVEAHGGRMAPSHSPLGGLRWRVALPLAAETTRHG